MDQSHRPTFTKIVDAKQFSKSSNSNFIGGFAKKRSNPRTSLNLS